MKGEAIERSSAVSATAKEFVSGRTEWEVSVSHLVMSEAPFEGLLMVNQTVTLSIVINGTRKTGTAICTSAEIGAPVGGIATGSAKFKGSGELA